MTITLHTPLTLGNLELPNRMIMAPLTRGRSGKHHIPNEMMAEYYRQRASAGLIVSEATAVCPGGFGWVGAPAIYSDEQQEGWRNVTNQVHKAGGRIFLQLWHMGRVSHPDFLDGGLPVAPSAVAAAGEAVTFEGKKPYVVPRELSVADMTLLIKQYAKATERALNAGFDGVEIHSANGYLLDQFLRDGSNHREDEYGGTVVNRLRFPLQVVDAVVAIASKERVGLRISPVNPYNDMRDTHPAELFTAYAAELAKRDLAYLHVLEALPGHFLYAEGYEPVLPEIRKVFPGILITNGGYGYESGNRMLNNGEADAIAYGVPFLANPDLVERFRLGADLNVPDMTTFYSNGRKGYTDYPFMN